MELRVLEVGQKVRLANGLKAKVTMHCGKNEYILQIDGKAKPQGFPEVYNPKEWTLLDR